MKFKEELAREVLQTHVPSIKKKLIKDLENVTIVIYYLCTSLHNWYSPGLTKFQTVHCSLVPKEWFADLML